MTTTPHADRGKAFEALIELSNAYYARQKIAYVQKVHVKKIESGGSLIYPEKSTVDYIGCWRGKFIAFDAKSAKGDKIPMKNIKIHQYNYLENISNNGGLGFFLIQLKKYHFINTPFDSAWILPVGEKYNSYNWIGRTRIDQQVLNDFGSLVKNNLPPAFNY